MRHRTYDPSRRVIVVLAALAVVFGTFVVIGTPAGAATTRPAIRSISPSSGVTAGGTKVTIRGKNFSRTSKVYFGGKRVARVTFASSKKLYVHSPKVSKATKVSVTVKTSRRVSKKTTKSSFNYVSAKNDRKVSGLRVTRVTNRSVDLAWGTPQLVAGDRIVVRRGSTAPVSPSRGAAVSVAGSSLRDEAVQAGETYAYSLFIVDRVGRVGPRYSVTAKTKALRNGLDQGDALRNGQRLYSSNGQYFLGLQSDGNLVSYVASSGRALWSSVTGGKGASTLHLQDDGNLVLYDAAGKATWNAGTTGRTGVHLEVQDDGNVVIYYAGGAKGLSTVNNLLIAGEALGAGQSIASPNGRYRLVMQGDGNLVEYDQHTGGALWSSSTSGPNWAIMQGDGNLVVYRQSAGAAWDSKTGGRPGSHLVLQDDGNLVIYQAGTAVWSRASGGLSGGTGGVRGDDYPANLKNAAMDSIVDPWRFYNRECTSFVAWRLTNANRSNFTNFMTGPNGTAGRFSNASNWGANARAIGFQVNGTPAVGAVAWWSTNHVAWVAQVNSNGTVVIEEYNSGYDGRYGTRTVKTSSVSGFIHIKDM